jgi:hypothetical protein
MSSRPLAHRLSKRYSSISPSTALTMLAKMRGALIALSREISCRSGQRPFAACSVVCTTVDSSHSIISSSR